MKKKIFLVLFVLLLTGCTNEYNITFDNDKIDEQIVATIPNTDIPVLTQEEINAGIEPDDVITPFILNDQYPFDNDDSIKYNKKVIEDGSTKIVTLDYSYNHDDYKKSKVYKNCFQTKNLKENNRDYTLNFAGKFYCLYGDELTVNIKTDNEVLYNNADSVKGNVYTWVINSDNMNNVDISMQISKSKTSTKSFIMIFLGVLGIILVIGGLIAYKNIMNRQKVNEI